MKKYYFIFILFFSIISVHGNPLHSHYKHTIIIDTDCAIDDMRAISLLLSLPNITIKGIMVSNGSLPPKEGVLKVKSLLHEFNRDSIPVFCGNEIRGINPAWRGFNQQLDWGYTTQQAPSCVSLQQIADIIIKSPEQVSLICLGPLTNLAQLIKKYPTTKSNIEDIVWYNESANPLKGFNYECDTKSAEKVVSLKIKLNIVSNLHIETDIFDTLLVSTCKNSNTLLAKVLYNTHNQSLAIEKLNQNHFKLWDELVVLYLTNPELFAISPLQEKNHIRYITTYKSKAIKEVLKDMITGKYKAGDYVAFYGFPIIPELYTYDIRMIMDSAIYRYGLDEWKACVMTDEFHGHLGVFSIIGAKMGMRARDFFGVGTDLLEVATYAGIKPPFSCMNDGIQVSTGATLGQGRIHIIPDSLTKPIAIFTYKGKSIRIILKPEYLKQIEEDIYTGITLFGLSDENYWSLIRQNALQYWLNWDRNIIFIVEEINNQ